VTLEDKRDDGRLWERGDRELSHRGVKTVGARSAGPTQFIEHGKESLLKEKYGDGQAALERVLPAFEGCEEGSWTKERGGGPLAKEHDELIPSGR